MAHSLSGSKIFDRTRGMEMLGGCLYYARAFVVNSDDDVHFRLKYSRSLPQICPIYLLFRDPVIKVMFFALVLFCRHSFMVKTMVFLHKSKDVSHRSQNCHHVVVLISSSCQIPAFSHQNSLNCN